MTSKDFPSVQFNDLSTQTDFSPRLSNSTFKRLDKIRRESSNLDSLITILRAKNDEIKLSQESMVNGLRKKKRNSKLQFQALVESRGQNLIFVSSLNLDDIDLTETIEILRRNDGLPRRSSIQDLVASTVASSIMNYSEEFY